MTLTAADYRVKNAPGDTLREQAREDQERAARAWIEMHLPEIDAAMSQENPEAALGIATTLHKVAIDRQLTKLDAELVQPVLARVVQAVIQKSTTTDRGELQGLLGFLDAQHDAAARTTAGLKFGAQADSQREGAKAAEASGHKLALYLHRALIDYFTMARVDDKDRIAKEADIQAATSIQYTVMDSTECQGTTGTINDFNRAHAVNGRVAKVHVMISRCSVEQVGDEVTRETKSYGVFAAGSSSTTKEDGHYERKSIQDSSGREIRTEGTGHYVEGSSSTSTVADSYVPTPVQVDVHRTTHEYVMQGTIVVDGDVPSVSVPISVSTKSTGEQWEPVQALGEGHWFESPTKDSGPSGPEVMQAGMQAALASATKATEQGLAKQFLAAGRNASGADAIDNYAAALFLDTSGDAVPPLEELLHVPAADLRAAVRPAPVFVASSDLAYKLAEPDELGEADKASIAEGFGELEHKSGGVQIELAAGVQTSIPTRIDMGTNAMPPDASSSYGLGIGMRIMGGVDPGRSESVGMIGGGGVDLRLGYAGGAFGDLQVPLYLGLRVSGFGVAAKVAAGWNKLGKDETGDLWVRNAPYVGYGLDFSYLTWGLTDFAASYGHYFRSEPWQQPDDFGIDPTQKFQIVGDEHRYELRAIRWAHGTDPAKTITARYSTFTGDSKDGYSFTLWIGMMADGHD
ncbi:hypothetical protein BH11MYX2_BH11MYX2_35920 [soil metagenome]